MSFDPKVSARHPDIPQDALFDLEATPRSTRKTRRVKPRGHGQCPKCRNEKVAQDLDDRNHLVWRDHTKSTIKGRKLPCSASGTRVES